MTTNTRPLRRRLTLATGLAAALALTVAAATPTPAAAISNQDCTYYSDSSHSQVVGERGVDCCGNSINWGVTSPYYTCEPVPVCIWCPPPSS